MIIEQPFKAKSMLNAKGIRFWLHGVYVGGCTELEQYFEDHRMWVN